MSFNENIWKPVRNPQNQFLNESRTCLILCLFSFISIALLDFPSCVIGEQPELTAETLEIGDTSQFCWRNIFSCINLLRVLNKLTKWKQSRIMVSKHETEKKRGSLYKRPDYESILSNILSKQKFFQQES